MVDFGIDVKREGDAGVLAVAGYINNEGGEQVATACYELIDGASRSSSLIWSSARSPIAWASLA